MSKVILYIYLASLTVDSYYCWITAINTKMISQNMDLLGYKDVIANNQLNYVEISYPGTKWCGPGNSAKNDDDLGTEVEADACCREHDKCPDVIGRYDSKHGLMNRAFYTRLNCDCDDKFYSCLKAGNTTTSLYVGEIYFNTLNTQCFKEDYPITGCVKRGGWFNMRCLEYTYDTTAEPMYQWFDVKSF
ncbi:hypothetical protein PYW08_008072 [Mythimna loreyi]|uniref:Uncharacterized protein n=1 Tax=Mythimna loreyi TaxID=667449 RepID=A0ACC2QD23_9NEOP|nr:hypothetical protein PYW08_008072 [Mythimna loreyi]